MAETKTNLYIEVTYQLYSTEDGKAVLLEETTDKRPFSFISGMGFTLDAFEAQIAPLKKGEKFDFTLTTEQAYGEYEAERVIKVPRQTFEINGKLDKEYIYEGAVVPLQNADGARFNGLIAKIEDAEITVDLNHPLAGKELTFKGEVVENREATQEEVNKMLKMLSGEGCGCDDCGGGCNGGGCSGGCSGCNGGCNED